MTIVSEPDPKNNPPAPKLTMCTGKKKPCPECNGTGKMFLLSSLDCEMCGGTGILTVWDISKVVTK
jgi:DnaJ-class molecular chaperone